MKTNRILMVLFLSGAVAGTSVVAEHHEHQKHEGDVMQKVTLIEKAEMDNELTANNLIGKDVYSSDGENIGKLHDLKLDGAQFAQLRMHFLQSQRTDRTQRTADRFVPGTDRSDEIQVRDPADRPADQAAESVERAGDRTADALRRVGDRTADTIQGMSQQQAQVTAIIQTGGLLGVGADYFAVPLDQLQYNAGEDRFQIGITQADVEQLRESGVGDETRPDTSPATTPY